MKKLFLLIVAAIVSVNIVAEGHMKFKGVEIDGSPKEFIEKMKAKGFTYMGNKSGVEAMMGEFATYKDCILYIVSSENKVVKVSVLILDETDTWSHLYSSYTTLKDMLTAKYGAPSGDKEEWQGYSEPRDDNSKMHKLKMNNATFGAYYEMPEGVVEISLFSMQMQCGVLLSYYDATNQKSVIEKAMDDL